MAVVSVQAASSLATMIRLRAIGLREVDGRPVLDLGAEHGGPAHERRERQERRDDEAVEEDRRVHLLVGVLAPSR